MDIEAQIIIRYWKDPLFKKALLKDPVKAIHKLAKELNISLPDEWRGKIRIAHQEHGEKVCVLPACPFEETIFTGKKISKAFEGKMNE